MTADKKPSIPAKAPTAGVPPTTNEASTRKAWVPKTPVDVVLEQIGKQEKRVAGLQKELDEEKSQLGKLLKAKAVLEA